MKSRFLLVAIVLLLAVAILDAKTAAARPVPQQSPAPAWNPATFKECDRACLIGIMDGYMNAIFEHDPKAVPPLALDVRMTENTGHMDVGEGMLWRSKVEPTSFKIYIADPVNGQVAEQARLKIEGRDALVAVRLKIDRGQDSGDRAALGSQYQSRRYSAAHHSSARRWSTTFPRPSARRAKC